MQSIVRDIVLPPDRRLLPGRRGIRRGPDNSANVRSQILVAARCHRAESVPVLAYLIAQQGYQTFSIVTVDGGDGGGIVALARVVAQFHGDQFEKYQVRPSQFVMVTPPAATYHVPGE
jgi:hypothetical protein